jgi:membrane protease YdiL (CAAX protease family)
VALNSALEQVQMRWFPALAEADRATIEWMVRDLSPALAILLGFCAGAGEEIAMRGALQPRLGLALSSVVFAVLHVQYTWFGMLTVALIGVLLGVIRKRTNTTTAVAVHAAYDVLVAVLTAR